MRPRDASGRCTKGEEAAVASGLERISREPTSDSSSALGREVATLRTMKRKLISESASSAAGSKGKKDIVKGLTLIANAYGALRHDVQVANGGPVPASKVNAAVSTDKKGRKKLLAGLKLLGG